MDMYQQFLSCRLCIARQDRRAQAEARAQALIQDDYRKLGPIKWGLVYVCKSHATDGEWGHFVFSQCRSLTLASFTPSVSHREPSRSSSCCLLFSSSHEIPSSSPAGLCFLKKGKKTQRIINFSTFPIGKWSHDVHTESPADGLTGLLLLSCRYVSDAVTGVIIVSVLFFFPSQKPSLSWWFDPQGQWPLGNVLMNR